MKILFINPINRSYVIMPSLGLGYLAAVARKAGHEAAYLNCVKERMTYESFGRYIRRNRFDLAGFQVFSYDLNSVRRHLSIVKELSPGTLTVGGGAHPSGDPEGTLSFLPQLDFAFCGEAEVGFPRFLEALEAGEADLSTVPGLVHRWDGRVQVNPPENVRDLDSLPMPAWDILKPETYPEAPHGAFTRQFPTAPIMVTRGCPYPCTFCAGKSMTGPGVRRRSVGNVLEELRYLNGRGIREFHIEDENFTANRALVTEFCERLLSEGLGMSWSLPSGVRLDALERDMLELMERAGCYSMALGIEFGAQRIMDLTKKRLTLELVREKLKLFEGLDIKLTGFFLLGVPGETLDEMGQTVRFALELPLHRAQFNNFMPLPGSELWRQLVSEGRIKDINWDRFFVHDVAWAGEGIDARDIKRLQRYAYLKFYLRPRIIRGLLGEVRSPRHLRFLLKRFLDAMR